jgi:hypothetical protein
MGAENAIEAQKRLVRELRRARKDARKANDRLRATVHECAHISEQLQQASERLLAAAVLMNRMVDSIGELAVASPDAVVTTGATDHEADGRGTARDADRRLDQVLLAQRRTNELLELALGTAIDARME